MPRDKDWLVKVLKEAAQRVDELPEWKKKSGGGQQDAVSTDSKTSKNGTNSSQHFNCD